MLILTPDALPSDTFPNSLLESRDAEVNQNAERPGFEGPGPAGKGANVRWTPSHADQLGQGSRVSNSR